MMSRIFSNNLKKRVDRWHKQVFIVKKYLKLLARSEPESILVARLGAIETIVKVGERMLTIMRFRFLAQLVQGLCLYKLESEREEVVNEKL